MDKHKFDLIVQNTFNEVRKKQSPGISLYDNSDKKHHSNSVWIPKVEIVAQMLSI